MRITVQLLRSNSYIPIKEVEYVDLSGKDIFVIERLSICQRLQTLILNDNNIEAIQNLDCCRQLWNLDLSGNRVKSLCGLSRFPVLGSLRLGDNNLDWQELQRISHITVLNLTLSGNPKLDSDPHYRQHVVDILPNVWMLDGKLITAGEQKEVERFFSESQASSRPVRRKTTENVFLPTSLKNLLVDGIFGDRATHMMLKFPISYIHNIDMDKKRLSYLIHTMAEDIRLAQSGGSVSFHNSYTATTHECTDISEEVSINSITPNLQSLFDHREDKMEQCNMLLLLLLAWMEYSLPVQLMHATLETAKLTCIGEINCPNLFSLPKKLALDIASLLLSAATLDRQEKKDGGLYEQLYKSLCSAMECVQKKLSQGLASKTVECSKKVKSSNSSAWRCLLASEVVHLMCLVPLFFDSLQTNKDLMKMVAVATRDPNVSCVIQTIVEKVQARQGDVWDIYHDIADYFLQVTSKNVFGKKKKPSILHHVHRTSSQLLHPTQPKLSPRLLRAMSAGSIKKGKPKRMLRSANIEKEPELGDLVIIGAEQIARIVALPESRTAVLQINFNTSVQSSLPGAYVYADSNSLVWDYQLKCWTKNDLAADLSTSRLSDSVSFANLPNRTSLGSVTAQIATPEHGPHTPRPHSGMSFLSDDLQTIPSQEELMDDKLSPNECSPQGIHSTPIRVDIGSSANTAPTSLTSVTSEHDHQKHILQQYSLNRLKVDDTDTRRLLNSEQTPKHEIELSPRSRAILELQRKTRDNDVKSNGESNVLIIPTPHLQFSDMWESEKSIPSTSISHNIRPHSCKVNEINKLALKTEPHMCPTSTPIPLEASLAAPYSIGRERPLVISDSTNFPCDISLKPVLHDAWTNAYPTKHSSFSSLRLMEKRQPKAPPIRNSCGQSTSASVYTVLHSRPPKHQLVQERAHSQGASGKYHYNHPKVQTRGGRRNNLPANFLLGVSSLHEH